MGRHEDTSDIDFVVASYRTMLGDGGREVRVTLNDAKPDRRKSRVLVASTTRRLITYAVKNDDGYVTRYDMPSYSFADERGLPAYYVSQDAKNVIRVYQTLSSSATDGTLLFTSKLPYSIRPLLLVDNGGKLTLCSNVPHDDDGVSVDGPVCTATGFLYVIKIDVMSGKWRSVFESTDSLVYSVAGVRDAERDVCGMLIANVNETSKPLLPVPTSFSEVPSFVNEKPPNMADAMNIPFGVSVYSPSDERLSVVPIGGSDEWGIDGVSVEKSDGDENIVTVTKE